MFPPQRIICLTEETVETLYLLGEDARIVGVSGFAQRPPQVRREKPRISAFTSADIDGIAALSPDLNMNVRGWVPVDEYLGFVSYPYPPEEPPDTLHPLQLSNVAGSTSA